MRENNYFATLDTTWIAPNEGSSCAAANEQSPLEAMRLGVVHMTGPVYLTLFVGILSIMLHHMILNPMLEVLLVVVVVVLLLVLLLLLLLVLLLLLLLLLVL
jgi:hypothetical protein